MTETVVPLRPSSRPSSEEIADELMRMIGRRDVNPGEQLREQALADFFGVSRGPVREALIRLAAAGVVRIDSNRGAFVTCLSDNEVIANSEMTGVLMGLAARRAAEHGTPQEIEAFVAAGHRLCTAMDAREATADDYIALARDCFRCMLTASHSESLAMSLRGFMYRGPSAVFTRYGVRTRPQRRQRARQWLKVAEAARDGRGTVAESAAVSIQMTTLKAALKVAEELGF